MPIDRASSFHHDDERALSSNPDDRPSYLNSHAGHEATDGLLESMSPSRDLSSPPPRYPSPVRPPSPTRSRGPRPSGPRPSRPSIRAVNSSSPTRVRTSYSARSATSLSPERRAAHRLSHARLSRAIDPGGLSAPLSTSSVTPGVDNFGDQVEGGGLNRLANSVAAMNPRESSPLASTPKDQARSRQSAYISPDKASYRRSQTPITPQKPEATVQRNQLRSRASNSSSQVALVAGAATPGTTTPGNPSDLQSYRTSRSNLSDEYSSRQPSPIRPLPNDTPSRHDSPFQYSYLNQAPQIRQSQIIPAEILDDGDDGFMPEPKRMSVLDFGRRISGIGLTPTPTEDGTRPKSWIGFFDQDSKGSQLSIQEESELQREKSPVRDEKSDKSDKSDKSLNDAGSEDVKHDRPTTLLMEKSPWLSRQRQGSNKMRWIVGSIIVFVIVLAIVGGVTGGVIYSKQAAAKQAAENVDADPNNNAGTDQQTNGDLDINSPEIKWLSNNPFLHKVFPGIDYTPWGTQYPLCYKFPPSQNNVTRDMAILSQLTNVVRLYGTDCNQTEMVLHSIDRLQLTDMKVWLGVWVDTNDTTTERQLAQMYQILENVEDKSIFKGAIVGNEALFRAGLDKASSETSLITILEQVKANFTARGWDMPVATSDLGDNWNADLVAAADLVMSNIHPFFAGVTAQEAANWTWEFWQNHDVPLTEGTSKPQVISETGWPSEGGTDCGAATTCTDGSVAGVDEMNTFMENFVCQALENGTDYFWFEAFDEPWKVIYNTPGKEWEDKWGLMDAGRNLKTGLKIPDCGGNTVGTGNTLTNATVSSSTSLTAAATPLPSSTSSTNSTRKA